VTREAARTGFEAFVDDAITHTEAEFDVGRALRQGIRGPGKRLVGKLLNDSETLRRRVVKPELEAHRDQILAQFDVLLEYVQSGEDIAAYREELLETDSYAGALRSDLDDERRAEIREQLLARQERLASAVRPLVEASEADFWSAVETAFDRESARRLVEDHFAFTGPFQEHRRAFEMTTEFDPSDILGGVGRLLSGRVGVVDVEYTDEALRAMRRAEQQVVADTTAEIDRRFS